MSANRSTRKQPAHGGHAAKPSRKKGTGRSIAAQPTESELAKKGKRPRMEWKVHTPNLLQEIHDNAQQVALRAPLRILDGILRKVAHRCSQINDKQLHALMARLTLYTFSNPEHADYDPELLDKVLLLGQEDEERKPKNSWSIKSLFS
jgi:hypothetical protein